MKETPKILLGALRQYRHNRLNLEGFVFGFDHDETAMIVTELQKRIWELEDENKKLKERLFLWDILDEAENLLPKEKPE